MNRLFGLVFKAWRLYRANGIGVMWRRVTRYAARRGVTGVLFDLDNSKRFERWLRLHYPTGDVLRRMEEEAGKFRFTPTIDVVMAVCDPDMQWLEATVASVRAQVYHNWHLCIADDASERTQVRTRLQALASEDPRIGLVRQNKRGGIASASNAALALGTGQFVCFLDHDDELAPHALFRIVQALNADPKLDVIYSDECALEVTGRKVDPHFKPDFAPDLLMSMNYIGHLVTCRRTCLDEVGGFRRHFDGSQDYDLLLRLTERTDRIHHIADILYLWRRIPGSSSGDAQAKPYAYSAAVRALTEAVERRGEQADVTMVQPGRYRVHYHLTKRPLVSIIIPTRNRGDYLKRCIESIQERTVYRPWEIVVVDNGTDDPQTIEYLQSLTNGTSKVIRSEASFNWSFLNNLGARASKGEFFLFLNNDTEVLSPGWLDEMVAQGQRAGVGAVGAKLLFPNNTVQHAGVIVGMGGVAGHAFYGLSDDARSYMDWTQVVRNVSAVTGACMLTAREVFHALGGFREDLGICYNDVDYCLRAIQADLRIVWTPYAKLLHHESISRRQFQPTDDEQQFLSYWKGVSDRFINPGLDIDDTLLRTSVARKENDVSEV